MIEKNFENWEWMHMKDKMNAIINGALKPKLSYYINPLWLRIMVIIVLFFLVLAIDLFE